LTYVFITHDLSVVKHISTEILVMYTGTMVEKCPSLELFDRPLHPYTKGLLSAIPVPNLDHKHEEILMQGELSSPIEPEPGCRFVSRCQYATETCSNKFPEYIEAFPDHYVACHNFRAINDME
jgi:peptide/nickel transport system ATP-binding protein